MEFICPWRFSISGWIKPWATCSDLPGDLALNKGMDYRLLEVCPFQPGLFHDSLTPKFKNSLAAWPSWGWKWIQTCISVTWTRKKQNNKKNNYGLGRNIAVMCLPTSWNLLVTFSGTPYFMLSAPLLCPGLFNPLPPLFLSLWSSSGYFRLIRTY